MNMKRDMQKAHIGAVDLDVLEAFLAVMRFGNVTEAARFVGATQPVLSQRLRRLRDLIGDPLFVRTPRGMVPTSRAERMAPDIEAAFNLLRAQVADRPTFDPRTADSRFVLLASGFGAALLAPRLASALKERAPFVQLRMRALDTSVHDQLTNGDGDVAFGILPRPAAGIKTLELYTDELCVVRRRNTPGSGRWAIVEGQQLPLSIEEHILRHDPHAEIALRSDTIVSLPGIIAESDLQVLLPGRLARPYAEQYPLELYRPAFPTPTFTLGIMWHERRDHDPAQAWFRALIAEPYARANGKGDGDNDDPFIGAPPRASLDSAL
jgi:DNA-binding transcriptional LysR family regulator